MTLPPAEVCDRARRTKDARFDGLFFTGVRTTRIYCRPVCPAPAPKPQNVVYFASAAAAVDAGFRPCLRCRPELAPGVRPKDAVVRRALGLIEDGWLDTRSVDALALRVGASPRHLRRLFRDKLGATPLQVRQSHRLLLARQLLTETALPVTEVALAAGFASLRRFNAAFRAECGCAPTAMRRGAPAAEGGALRLRLAYRPPLAWDDMLARLARHAVPGIERVHAGGWERTLATASVRVTPHPARPELTLEASGVEPARIEPLVRTVRRVFDLDADLVAVHAALASDPALAASIAARPGLRLAGAWCGFEAAVQALLDWRLGARRGAEALQALLVPAGSGLRLPAARELADSAADPALRALAVAVRDGVLGFDPSQPLEDFVAGMRRCSGLPAPRGHALAARALGNPDAWPGAGGAPAWRPWRAYAALHGTAADAAAAAGRREKPVALA